MKTLKFLRENFLSFTYFLNILVVVLSFVYLANRLNSLPPQVPIWYTLPWGNNQLGEKDLLWLIPGSMLFFFILNLVLSIFVFKRGSFLARLLDGQGLLLSLLGLLSLWRIIVITA